MYGNHRFLFQNNIERTEQLWLFSLARGIVSGAQKDGTGSAVLQATGQYSGIKDLLILLQIHDVSGGKEVGEAKYRYRTSETPEGYWEDQNILTHSDNQELFDDINIRFISGDSDDFEESDNWYFRAFANWGPAHLIDLDRGTVYRSEELEAMITIVFNQATQNTALVLLDHNIQEYYQLVDIDGYQLVDVDGNTLVVGPSTMYFKGTEPERLVDVDSNTLTDIAGVPLIADPRITLEDNPDYSQQLTIADPLVFYFDQTFSYFQVAIDDAGNPENCIEIGELYLGNYMELEGNADWGSTEELVFIGPENTNSAGVVQEAVDSEQRRVTLNYGDISNPEVAQIIAMLRAIKTPKTRQVKPIFFHEFSDENDTLILARITSSGRTFTSYEGNSLALNLEEIVKTRY